MSELLVLLHQKEEIVAVDTATGSARTVVESTGGGPDGIALAEGYIFYSTMGTPRPNGTQEGDYSSPDGGIHRVAFDGTAATGPVEDLVATDDARFSTGKQLIYADGALYVGDREGHKVWRVTDPAGSAQLEQLLATDPAGSWETTPVGVAVHDGTLYWTQKGPSKGGHGSIHAAELTQLGADAVDPGTTLVDGLPEPIDLAVVGDYMYWTDRGAEPDGNSLNRAPLADLSQVEVVVRGLHEAIGLALDPEGSAVWVSDLSGTIYRVDAETTEATAVAHLDTPATGIVFV